MVDFVQIAEAPLYTWVGPWPTPTAASPPSDQVIPAQEQVILAGHPVESDRGVGNRSQGRGTGPERAWEESLPVHHHHKEGAWNGRLGKPFERLAPEPDNAFSKVRGQYVRIGNHGRRYEPDLRQVRGCRIRGYSLSGQVDSEGIAGCLGLASWGCPWFVCDGAAD